MHYVSPLYTAISLFFYILCITTMMTSFKLFFVSRPLAKSLKLTYTPIPGLQFDDFKLWTAIQTVEY